MPGSSGMEACAGAHVTGRECCKRMRDTVEPGCEMLTERFRRLLLGLQYDLRVLDRRMGELDAEV